MKTNLFKQLRYFANEATEKVSTFFFANQFAQDKENWVQLAPFGDFTNTDAKKNTVIQRFRKEDAESICNEFNGISRKITQPLGMPFYVGHPDHPRFRGQPGHTDTAAKGRGKKMEVRHDPACSKCAEFANSGVPCNEHGLFVQMHWSPQGEQIIGNEAYHGHSINWGAVPVGKENGVQIFRPVRVKSAGFTNEPNIPVTPASLANEAGDEDTTDMIIPPKLKLIAGFKQDEDVTMDQIIAALEKAKPLANETAELTISGRKFDILLANADDARELAQIANDASEALGFFAWLQSKMAEGMDKLPEGIRYAINALLEYQENEQKLTAAMGEKLANVKPFPISAEAAFAAERKARIDLFVNSLVSSGKIITADKEATIAQLANAGDKFDDVAAQLANAKPVVKTGAHSAELAGKHAVITKDVRQRTVKFESLMSAREQQFPNESYEDRYNAVAGSPEGQQLFAQMQRPGGPEDKKD